MYFYAKIAFPESEKMFFIMFHNLLKSYGTCYF